MYMALAIRFDMCSPLWHNEACSCHRLYGEMHWRHSREWVSKSNSSHASSEVRGLENPVMIEEVSENRTPFGEGGEVDCTAGAAADILFLVLIGMGWLTAGASDGVILVMRIFEVGLFGLCRR